MSEPLVRIDVVKGVEGPSIYIDDHRVAGPKPWGGGDIIVRLMAKRSEVLAALKISGSLAADLEATTEK